MIARLATLALGVGLGAVIALPMSGWTAEPGEPGTSPAAGRQEYSLFRAAKESLFGDPYSHPERWQPLSLGTFFTEGWDEPWISPPKGGGGAPRQSWRRPGSETATCCRYPSSKPRAGRVPQSRAPVQAARRSRATGHRLAGGLSAEAQRAIHLVSARTAAKWPDS